MKRKTIETPTEIMEALQTHISELIHCEKSSLMENIEEMDDFQRGQCKGACMAYEEIYSYLRNLIKHGYDHLTVEDYSDYCVAPEQE